MKRAAGYVIAIVALVLVLGTAAEFSTRTATCMTCHRLEASFAEWMTARLNADNKGFSHELIGCADCHILGAPQRTVMSRMRGLLHTVTYLVPQIDPRAPRVSGLYWQSRVPAENCQFCHLGAIQRKEALVKDLPPGLQKIGLLMDHRKHVLAKEDTCAKCHERYKEKDMADRNVNYAEVNHLSCDSCHSYASHAYRAGRLFPLTTKEYVRARDESWKTLSGNPRWMVAIPAETTCRRCHDGKIHYKTKIFLSDCRQGDNYENCVKCHPLMTPQYFEQYRKERRSLTSVPGTPEGDG